jgi:hypothetical protein
VYVQKLFKEPGVVPHFYNPSICEAKAGGSKLEASLDYIGKTLLQKLKTKLCKISKLTMTIMQLTKFSLHSPRKR